MKRGLVALASGIVFSLGLCLSGMTHPSKVLGFLDFFGQWDPSLAFVMVGAISVSAVAFRLSRRRAAPLFDDRFHLARVGGKVDRRVLLGSAVFGVGWGLSGLCPGPAVTSLVTGRPAALVFVGAMVFGMLVVDVFERAAHGVLAEAGSDCS
jgi:uncharacterized membrane protein YedE/YeeE